MDSLIDVATIIRSRRVFLSRCQPAPRRASIIDIDNLALGLCAGLLPLTTSPDLVCGNRITARYSLWIPADQCGNNVVHVQQQRHVLRRGENDRHERTCRVSAGLVLCWLWDHVNLLKQRDGQSGCYEGWHIGILVTEPAMSDESKRFRPFAFNCSLQSLGYIHLYGELLIFSCGVAVTSET